MYEIFYFCYNYLHLRKFYLLTIEAKALGIALIEKKSFHDSNPTNNSSLLNYSPKRSNYDEKLITFHFTPFTQTCCNYLLLILITIQSQGL